MQYMILFYYYTFNRLETQVYDVLNISFKKKNNKTQRSDSVPSQASRSSNRNIGRNRSTALLNQTASNIQKRR